VALGAEITGPAHLPQAVLGRLALEGEGTVQELEIRGTTG
jgi:hypothetical protein